MGEWQTHTEMEKALVIQWTEFALFTAYGLLRRVSENSNKPANSAFKATEDFRRQLIDTELLVCSEHLDEY